MTPLSPGARVHLVLVPGFAGFDALGQLEYYAGVTPLLRRWHAGRAGVAPVVIHYFDNLPTASVATRAGRLRQYLAKRHARGEIQPADAVALIGHSTGGLDIRRLLLDLDVEARRDGLADAVDGNRENALRVPAAELLERVDRVVFLSVPQRGTNIADWVRGVPRKALLAEARLLVRAAAKRAFLNDAEEATARWFGRRIRSDLFLALSDTVAEMDAAAVEDDLARVADAHEAAADLQLFLTHIASDFGAIDDLAAEPALARRSPAHLDEDEREAERATWRRWGIETRSYATVGRRPYRFTPGEAVPVWAVRHPSTAPWARLEDGACAQTDAAYLCGYRACAGGPFAAHAPAGTLVGTVLGTSEKRLVERWDNDGIVNTASMLWPEGPETRIVDGDHGDVIGHYRLVEDVDGPPLRRYHTYDLLRSASGFTEQRFRDVWFDVFEFCVGGRAAAAAPPLAAGSG